MNNLSHLSILSAAVRAATTFGADVDVVNLMGRAHAILDAEAQGSGITLSVKLQSCQGLLRGYSFDSVGDQDIPLRNNAADNVKLSVAYTQSGARQVKRIGLMLKQKGAIAAGKNIWLTIEADNAGAPSGTPLATSSLVEAASVGAAYASVPFTFATPLNLEDSTLYHVVLQGDYTAGATNQIQWRAATVASDGNAEVYDTSWADVVTNSFEIYIDQYTFVDVPGAAFADVGNAVSLQELILPVDTVGEVVRGVATVAGGSATGASSLLLLGQEQYV